MFPPHYLLVHKPTHCLRFIYILVPKLRLFYGGSQFPKNNPATTLGIKSEINLQFQIQLTNYWLKRHSSNHSVITVGKEYWKVWKLTNAECIFFRQRSFQTTKIKILFELRYIIPTFTTEDLVLQVLFIRKNHGTLILNRLVILFSKKLFFVSVA